MESEVHRASAKSNSITSAAPFSLEAAEKWVLEKTAALPPEPFRLTSYWHIDFVRQPAPQERKTRYTMRMAQSENYGLAFALHANPPKPDADFVGKDARQILKKRLWRDLIDRTALVDLVMGNVSQTAGEKVTLEGTVRSKYLERGRIFAEESERLLRRKEKIKGNEPHVVVVGATAGILSALQTLGYDVSATDLSGAIVGKRLSGVKVLDATKYNECLMAKADLAIITGMTLPNRTLPVIMKHAQKYKTSTMIWAITGRNFGSYYLEQGADCVISDPSPFLLLPGPASFVIHRSDNSALTKPR